MRHCSKDLFAVLLRFKRTEEPFPARHVSPDHDQSVDRKLLQEGTNGRRIEHVSFDALKLGLAALFARHQQLEHWSRLPPKLPAAARR